MDVCYKNTKHYKTGFCHRGDLSACSFGQKYESHCIKSSSSVRDELLFYYSSEVGRVTILAGCAIAGMIV